MLVTTSVTNIVVKNSFNIYFFRLAISKSDERQRRRNAAQQAVSNVDDQIDSDEEIFNDIYADINDFEEISSDPEDSANIDIYSSSDQGSPKLLTNT